MPYYITVGSGIGLAVWEVTKTPKVGDRINVRVPPGQFPWSFENITDFSADDTAVIVAMTSEVPFLTVGDTFQLTEKYTDYDTGEKFGIIPHFGIQNTKSD